MHKSGNILAPRVATLYVLVEAIDNQPNKSRAFLACIKYLLSDG